jgi:tyrosyl-tRNA synthetase
MEEATVENNMVKLFAAVQKFFERARDYAVKRIPSLRASYVPPLIMNNTDWFKNLSVLEFMRVAGTAARVNSMIARERQVQPTKYLNHADSSLRSVQSRLNSQQGISFSEFSYQLLQAYDFLALYEKTGCTVQVGGSDQWGNIIAGLELIGRTSETLDAGAESHQRAYGITTPLLATADGAKFGKSTGNAIWLNEQLTTVYDFYQVSVNFYPSSVGTKSSAALYENERPRRWSVFETVHSVAHRTDRASS